MANLKTGTGGSRSIRTNIPKNKVQIQINQRIKHAE